jgi:uncharacterized protein
MKLQLEKTEWTEHLHRLRRRLCQCQWRSHNCNLAVLPDRLLPNWTQATFETLCAADLELLASLDAEIILLGTGNQLRFPEPGVAAAVGPGTERA